MGGWEIVIMKPFRTIWKHEVQQAQKIALALLSDQALIPAWRFFILPLYLMDRFRFDRRVRQIRRNLLFTKKLALEAAKNVHAGKQRTWEMRRIEARTGDILAKEKKGLYTEPVRLKQLAEIEVFTDYYLDLIDSNQNNYVDMVKALFGSKGKYLNFLASLQRTEQDVMQAAVDTMRTGSKKERRQWFEKVGATSKKIRLQEADAIFQNP
jgi:hypothetical protein